MGWRRTGVWVLVAAAAGVPLVADDFQLFRVTNVLIYAIALIGLNILVGYNGQISMGHGAFYAVGAYAAAILLAHFDVPHWAAVPAAGLLCLVAGLGFGYLVLRLDGMHLAMATFALGAVLPTVAKHKGIEHWTGGTQGMSLDQPRVPFGLPVSFDQWLYLFTLLVLVLSMVAAAGMLRGRIGRALVAIRDQPLAAQAMGIPVAHYRTAAFGISAMYTGIAGAISAMALQYVAPGLFGIFLSFSLLMGAMVGGVASLGGAVYGAAFLQLIFFLAGTTAHVLQSTQFHVIFGVILILVVHLMPGGVASIVQRVGWRRWTGH